jgi:hypothetical protein
VRRVIGDLESEGLRPRSITLSRVIRMLDNMAGLLEACEARQI